MWKVGGSKIERTQARYIVYVCFFGQNALYPNASKSQTFFVGLLNIVNPSTTRKFQKELELQPHPPPKYSGGEAQYTEIGQSWQG